MNKTSKIYVAGHRGLVGSAILRNLKENGFTNIVCRTRQEVNLLDQKAVHDFFAEEQFDFVFLSAAKVGGILANSQFQADFLYENLMIACNVIHAAAVSDVDKLLFLGSSCIYPKMAKQPIQETELLTGPLESTNEGYALAKITGLKLCEMYRRQYGKNFISAMPTNLYGPNDNFHPEHSHVVPALLRRFHESKQAGKDNIKIWGTGTPKREFLHVDDLASALTLLMDTYESTETINVGTGVDCTIKELAETIQDVTQFKGSLEFDSSYPDGTPRKVLDVSRITKLGWSPKYSLRAGLENAYQWALDNKIL